MCRVGDVKIIKMQLVFCYLCLFNFALECALSITVAFVKNNQK